MRWRAAMSDRYRVVCPDVVGRGRSERLRDPGHYVVPQYVADMVTLIARVTAANEEAGALGRHLDGRPDRHDPGLVRGQPDPPAGAERYRPGAGPGPRWRASASTSARTCASPSFEDGARFVKDGLGLLRPAQRRRMAQAGQRRAGAGARRRLGAPLRPGPGPALRRDHAERAEQDQAALWAAFDAIRCPTLLIRGELSDLLSRATAEEMTRRGPKPRWPKFPASAMRRP
jgi:pimeloyl-ACP methyl ester carboxylesterase